MGALLEPGTFEPAAFTDEALVARVRALAGVPDLPVELERTGRFTCGAQVAERFRQGSAFLVGDAAHRATPRGGTGMNTGIQDGYDLGWKLHWVLAGWADEALLDTYETERRPVAQHNVERSLVAGIGQDLHADLGGRLTHVWLEDGRSSLDLAGEGLTLVTASPERVAVPATGWVPLELEVVDPIAARALGIPRDGALLVRPDATPVATLPARVAEPALAA
jgi:putative polyketide hydroxylase